MRCEWDDSKNRKNVQKHGVSFEIAAEVFNDPLCLTIADQTVKTEERFWAIGCVDRLVILVVVHTSFDDEKEVIRIISARKATSLERKFYEEADQ